MKTIAPQSPVETLYQEGRKTFIELVPNGGARLDALFCTAPALGELAVGVVYGYLHGRSGLDHRLQEAAIFAAIVAAGMVGPPLSVHFNTSLAEGLAPGELTELLLLVSAFTGFPRAVATAEQLNQLFASAGLPSPPPPTPRAVVMAFCDSVRRDQPSFPVSAQVRKLLRKPHRLSLQATAADRVVIESYKGTETNPRGMLLVRVANTQVVEVTAYSPMPD
ncbi:carboxymuconolactone decarboxylase [Pseudomonas azotoformans]|uniref:Carboxymuconolactone decarboxylase n=1 Tax=Pseudomonas azotoformans TaxID=47878 RepID=A0A1V2JNT5_PSEAZ|nr:carboxymuconolactone decarboxylase family protein [Pseudomonas azotoformans]OIN47217.1 carboxymuconolactone decarboxylase [Pseudomonas azotoformans]ONH47118.1 carboxymuconolactone decarboxylase [Pseudomonas azotoformans]SDM76343.1 4-carboxymuconolactone decarboxylase [Pseudomonas azotoformans]